MDEYLREPSSAGMIAAAATLGYIHLKATMNKEKLPNSAYFKPAVLVGLLVYIIVSRGGASKETISTEPY
jgi:ABC-type tungstate transport system substrate-binding protein